MLLITLFLGDVDEQVLNSTPIQTSQKVTESTNKNSSQLLGSGNKRSIRKVDTSGSKKNLKRKSTDIQSYFTNSGNYVHNYVHDYSTCSYIRM